MKTLILLLATILSWPQLGSSQARSRLVAARCPNPFTGDSTASIRVALDPPEARRGALSLTLHQLRSNQPDSLIANPAYGVDTITGLPLGLYRLWVRQIGYSHPQDTLRIGRGEAWCVVAHMVRDTIHLIPVAP